MEAYHLQLFYLCSLCRALFQDCRYSPFLWLNLLLQNFRILSPETRIARSGTPILPQRNLSFLPGLALQTSLLLSRNDLISLLNTHFLFIVFQYISKLQNSFSRGLDAWLSFHLFNLHTTPRQCFNSPSFTFFYYYWNSSILFPSSTLLMDVDKSRVHRTDLWQPSLTGKSISKPDRFSPILQSAITPFISMMLHQTASSVLQQLMFTSTGLESGRHFYSTGLTTWEWSYEIHLLNHNPCTSERIRTKYRLLNLHNDENQLSSCRPATCFSPTAKKQI